jgi:HTH-type transcriptional regulator / antitoxin HigA
MDSDSSMTYEPNEVGHPGDTVVDYLEFNNWSQRDLARRTDLTPKTISEICNGKAPITPPTSLAFEKVFRRPAHFWLNLQRRFDEALARRHALAKSTEWKSWASKFPLAQMKRYGWLDTSITGQSPVETLLGFLGVSSPNSWSSVWKAAGVAYRQTRKLEASPEAISAWVRATELYAEFVASKVRIADFDEARLVASLDQLRQQSRYKASQITGPVQEICGAAGVIVVWVPDLPGTGISGCARWMGERKALIALTLRYKTDDQMWFTLFHEVAHILLHRKRRDFILDNAAEDLSDRIVDPEMQKEEEEANRFAADTLIPPEALAAFIKQADFGNDAIHDFAEKIGIGPGLVVGRLQFEELLAHHQGNKLKQQLDFQLPE